MDTAIAQWAVAIGFLIVLAGCAPATPEQREAAATAQREYNAKQSRFITTVDGCRIWEVYNPNGDNPFFARCPEGAADTFEQHTESQGKTSKTVKTFTLGDH
jgi:hypothetical protein